MLAGEQTGITEPVTIHASQSSARRGGDGRIREKSEQEIIVASKRTVDRLAA